ncbi:acyltransferase [Rhizobium sp. LCM 4573]|uniref:acyltransferase family protein n=1 Tax=Rhizobium sp. LCM 4573 TaxID=1848291 RepID=UPI0008D96312|nr:acyltransferase family protein [Rhizobium sp. LCM 4573]OHV77124.1 hypothetical protein LCM4573_10160 [Rhizobium sp. LCM 4573]
MRIYYLDGLRGLLALSVLLSHIAGGITGWTSDRLFRGAFLAVDLFFVLSGFVLARVLVSEKYGLKSFFWMRFWRLWPLHMATILLSLIVFELNRSIGQYAPPDGSFSDVALVWKTPRF